MTEKNLRKVRKAAVLSLFWDFVCKLETRSREGDQAGFYKHLKTMNLEGKRDRSSAYVKHENGILLKDVEVIRERWVRWFHTLLCGLEKLGLVDQNWLERNFSGFLLRTLVVGRRQHSESIEVALEWSKEV